MIFTETVADTIPGVLARAAAKFPVKPAVVGGSRSLTFPDLQRRALAIADRLEKLGVTHGQRVGLLMEKSLEQVAAVLGVLHANAVMVPIHPSQKRRGLAHIIRNCGMTALITDSNLLPSVVEFAGEVHLVIGRGDPIGDHPCLPKLDDAGAEVASAFNCTGQDNAAIIYSSGSTGPPKGILISHDNLVRGARIVSGYLGTRQDDRIALVLTLTSDYGLNQLWQTLYQGASLFLHDPFLPADLLAFLEAQRITALPLMPVIINRIFDPRFPLRRSDYDLSALRYVTSTGAVVTKKMLEQLQSTFQHSDIYLMYGLTEAFRSTYMPPSELARRPNSIGKAIPEVEVLVLDENDRPCPPGVSGELVHRGGCITKGYWNDAAATARRFRQLPRFPGETVVFSGDIAKSDSDGFLYFIARRDAMIKTRGFRVGPGEIEEAACGHGMVTAAVAFDVKSSDSDNDIVLAYAASSAGPSDDREILRYLKSQLPHYMIPRYLLRMEEFPTTGNGGKIDRVWVIENARERLGLSAS
jgi:amino acid adenylation domain-containing protein